MRPKFAQALQNCMSFSSKIIFICLLAFSGEWSSFTANEDKLEKKEDQGGARRGQVGGRGYAKWHLSLPAGGEAPKAGARRDAGLPAERAELAPSAAAADAQPASQRWPDDAVQYLKVEIASHTLAPNSNELHSIEVTRIVFQSVKANFKNEVWFNVKFLSNKSLSSPEAIIQYRVYWESA